MKLSIVTTLYFSAPYMAEFHRRASAAASTLAGSDYEIIMVNDGSPDGSLREAMSLADRDPHVRVVDLSRNFGHHRAMMTGFAQARGELVFSIDIDLEEDPELLLEFWQVMRESGADCVYGYQTERKGGFFEKWSGYFYYRLLNAISSVRIPENVLMAKLMTRRFVDSLLEYRERSVFLGGLLALTGYEQKGVPCRKGSKGTTTYTLSKKINQAIDSVTSFCSKPLYYIFVLGVGISGISALGIFYLLFRKIFYDNIFSGWTSLMLTLCFGFGLIISILGILGLYLARIFDEVKGRPYATIRRVYPDVSIKTGRSARTE